VPRSVLIVKLAAIGDVAMALPMITALRSENTQKHITWLCGTIAAPLLRCVDGIEDVIAIDEAAVLAGNRARKAQAVMAAWSALRGKRFDLVLTAHTDSRYRLFGAGVRATERRWLGERGARSRLVAGRYYGDEYVRLATEVDDGTARRFAPPPLRVELDRGVGERLARLDARAPVALAPGGARNPGRDDPLRRWPVERYAEVARELVRRGRTVLLTGAPNDAWIRPAFEGIDVVDLVGATTLPGLVALYARCGVVVTHDSGPLHLARLSGAPLVGLFGPTSPASMLREDARTIALWPGAMLPCAPCYDGRNFAPCGDNVCMQHIGSNDVVARVDALLAR
jgi:heptosyltransferase-2